MRNSSLDDPEITFTWLNFKHKNVTHIFGRVTFLTNNTYSYN